MTARLIDDLSANKLEIEIWTDSDINHDFFKTFNHPVKKQIGEDLGERMAYAIGAGLSSFKKVILVGTDLPDLNGLYIEDVSKALDRFQVVIGPTLDGGFGLLAAKDFDSSIFKNISWGSSEVLETLCRNTTELGLEFYLSKALWDIDRPNDFVRYQSWLNQ